MWLVNHKMENPHTYNMYIVQSICDSDKDVRSMKVYNIIDRKRASVEYN